MKKRDFVVFCTLLVMLLISAFAAHAKTKQRQIKLDFSAPSGSESNLEQAPEEAPKPHKQRESASIREKVYVEGDSNQVVVKSKLQQHSRTDVKKGLKQLEKDQTQRLNSEIDDSVK